MTLGFRSAWQWTFICVLLTWGLVVNCWGLDPGWELCYSKNLKHTFMLTGPDFGYLMVVGCPPGVSGTCFGAGPKMKDFNNRIYKDQRCAGAESGGLRYCDDSPGDIVICLLAYETYSYGNFLYIHSSNPPGIVYAKRKHPPIIQVPPPPPPPPDGKTSRSTFFRNTPEYLNSPPTEAERKALEEIFDAQKYKWEYILV